MSEAFECDRCGALKSGSPAYELHVDTGRPRWNKTDERPEHRGGELQIPAAEDICRGCLNDLRAWWENGGGDPADIERVAVDDE